MSESENAPRASYMTWQQGDYALNCGALVTLKEPEDQEDDGLRLDDTIQGLAVVTQTCEIVRNTDIVPCVTVCPLIEIEQSRIRDIERGTSPRYTLLYDLPEGVVVDLTRAMSVEKSLLGFWDRQVGCPDEESQRKFAGALERTFGRYAYPDLFVETMRPFRRKVLDKHGKVNGLLGAALENIEEFRCVVHSAWDDPDDIPVSFYIIVNEDTAENTDETEKVRKAIISAMSGVEWTAPYRLHDQGIHITTYQDLSARDYLNSHPLSENDLSGV